MKILVAEDEPVLARFLTHVLSNYGQCVQVGTGLAAVDEFERALDDGEPFNLIVLDIMMPLASGQDALREIRAIEAERDGGAPHTAVMMCTALEDSSNIYEAHSQGCIEYLVKPVGKRDLVKALGKLGFVPASNDPLPDA